jgi:molecular chaperone HscC
MIIGIDLGTTHSLCAVFRNGVPQLVPNPHGKVLTPSVVAILDDDQVVVGEPARDFRVTHPERCAATFKRLMGTPQPTKLGKRSFSPIELSSLILKSLKEDAEHFLQEVVTDAVITVPAYFNDSQRRATRQAGEVAGLNVRRIVNEPTAAALTYGFHDRDADKRLLVVDLGGGTFDVTLMQIFEGTLEIVATAGENFLGGEDFTMRLVSDALNQTGKRLELAEMKEPLLVARLREDCERAKRLLATQETAEVTIPLADGTVPQNGQLVTFDRQKFLSLSQPLLERLQGPLSRVLRDGNVQPKDLEDIILVGGATRMPAVSALIEKMFGKGPLCRFNPDEVVALGAAVQAALIEDDAAVGDMVMTDVCPFTLGVEVSKQFGNEFATGYFSPIIHRNTTIPVSKEDVFSTIEPMQTRLALRIYQGEGRRVKDNFQLGELVVTGIPARTESQLVRVRFTYDLNGILEVEAFVEETGKRFSTVLTGNAGHLDQKEIEEALKRMQKLKFYPRDDIANRRLLLFAESKVGEVAPDQRSVLEAGIDQFERAMSSGEKNLFDEAKTVLLNLLSEMGLPFSSEFEQGGDVAE